MASLSLAITPYLKQQKVLVEIDAAKFERLAANLGFFSEDFLKSVERAERDYRLGRFRKITSLKSLRA